MRLLLWSRGRRLGLTALGASAALLTGCAGLQQPEVEHVAVAFATGDASTRCELLSAATLSALEAQQSGACGQAIGRLAPNGGRVVHTEVWGEQAQVRLTDDTIFLTRTRAGWRVAAAGCRPNGEAPYQCRVEGP